MDKLLIADDEKIVIDSLQFIIGKYFPDTFEVFSARSGREAIAIAEQNHVDIAFMDISMTGINGVQTIRQMRETHPDIIFIILSAYDKFEYAAEALRLGVMDYLLKPIRREKIVEVLGNAREQLAHRKQIRLRELDTYEQMSKANHLLEKELVSSAISPRADIGGLQNHLRILGIEQMQGYCLILQFDNVFLERNGVPMGLGESLGSDYRTVWEQVNTVGRYLLGSYATNHLVALRVGNCESERDVLLEEGLRIRQKLSAHVDAQVTVSWGGYFSCLEEAAGSYREALLALRFCSASVPVIRHAQVRELLVQEEGNQGCSMGKPIQQAIAYIDRRYAENLTLDRLAEYVNMSPNYFSALFKEEAGCNFIDYLTCVRMDKAKAMLREQKWSIKEIALSVGFHDSSYFTRIFKKSQGVTPTEYL